MEQFYIIISVSMILMVSPMIAKAINSPLVVVELFLGMLAGVVGLIEYDANLKLIAKFGFLYLMFLAGLEINLKLVKTIKKELSLNVTGYFILLYAIAISLSMLLNLSPLYYVALPIFSLGMLMMLVKEYGKNEQWLNLAVSIGVVGEVVSILALTIFSGWLEFGFENEFYIAIFKLFIVIVLSIVFLYGTQALFWWYPELKVYIIPNEDRYDQDIRFTMSLFFILIACMIYLKVDAVIGAFLAGLFMRMFFHEKHQLIEKLSSFGFGFFAPIFFIYTGSTVKLDVINMDILQNALFIIIAIISIRLISSFLAFYKYLKFKNTILFALSDSMPLTFLVAVSMLAYEHGLIKQAEYFSFIIASMIDGLLLMVFIRWMYSKFYKS
ncbi:MAG: cation:proton antiporter [Sulfurovum sp.]|nr:MAG: cation:proton antiporter [Sulfurovum sp.]